MNISVDKSIVSQYASNEPREKTDSEAHSFSVSSDLGLSTLWALLLSQHECQVSTSPKSITVSSISRKELREVEVE